MAHNSDYQPKQSSKGSSQAIYGSDDCGFANRIAADALDPVGGQAATNLSDYWGKTVDDKAEAIGSTDAREEDTVKIIRKAAAGGGDKEALNDSTAGGQRHRKGEGSF
jgi:hypothetical protein